MHQFIVEFEPLTLKTEDLNFENEINRLYFVNKLDGHLSLEVAPNVILARKR